MADDRYNRYTDIHGQEYRDRDQQGKAHRDAKKMKDRDVEPYWAWCMVENEHRGQTFDVRSCRWFNGASPDVV